MPIKDLFHVDCYTEFATIESRGRDGELKITLLGYWSHHDDHGGVDELADFLVSEYTNEHALRFKAQWIVGLLNASLGKQ